VNYFASLLSNQDHPFIARVMKLTENYEKRLSFQIKRLLFQNRKSVPSRVPFGLHNTKWALNPLKNV
jgi:hypothetical protein